MRQATPLASHSIWSVSGQLYEIRPDSLRLDNSDPCQAAHTNMSPSSATLAGLRSRPGRMPAEPLTEPGDQRADPHQAADEAA